MVIELNKEEKYETVLAICEELAASNNPQGMLRLGRMYREGKVVGKDISKAFELFKKAYNKGFDQAGLELLDLYHQCNLWTCKECLDIISAENKNDSVNFRQWLYKGAPFPALIDKPAVLNFLLISTDNYFPYTDVLIRSICANNRSSKLVFHVVTDSNDNSRIECFKQAVSKNACELYIEKVNVQMFDRFQDNGKWNKLRFAKLLPHVVSNIDSDRVLFLDIDIVVCGDISDLFRLKLDGYALAGAKSSLFFNSQYKSRDIDKIQQRINAGVVLFNLDYFRDNSIDIDYYFKTFGTDALHCTEETILNNAFRGRILFFDEYEYHHKVVTAHNFRKFHLPRNNVKLFHFEGSTRAAMIKPWECFGDVNNPTLAPSDSRLNTILSEFFGKWWEYAKGSDYYEALFYDDSLKYSFYKGVYSRIIEPLVQEKRHSQDICSEIALITSNKARIINFIERNSIERIELNYDDVIIQVLQSVVSIPVFKSEFDCVMTSNSRYQLNYGLKQLCESSSSCFDVVCSLGYDCEVNFMIKCFYGFEDNYITSWSRIGNQEKFLNCLSNLDKIMSEGLLPDDSMVMDNYSGMRFHTRGVPNLKDESKLQLQLEELRSRLTYLSLKTKRMFDSRKRKLFIVKYEERGGLSVSDFINKLDCTLSEITCNYTLLVVLLPSVLKEVSISTNQNVYLKTISKYAFPARAFNKNEWRAILSEFEPYLFLK